MFDKAGISLACMAYIDPVSKQGLERDGSAVKSTDHSFEGPQFKSQQLHGGSQQSIMRSDALFWGV